MKKLLVILLALALLVTVCACGNGNTDTPAGGNDLPADGTNGSSDVTDGEDPTGSEDPTDAPTETEKPVEVVLYPIDPKEHVENANYYFENAVCNKDPDGNDLIIVHNPSGKGIAVHQTAVQGGWTIKARVQIGEYTGTRGDVRISLGTSARGAFAGLVVFEYDKDAGSVRLGTVNQVTNGSWTSIVGNSGWMNVSNDAFDFVIIRDSEEDCLIIQLFDVNGKMVYYLETDDFYDNYLDTVTHLGLLSYSTQAQFSNVEVIPE